MQPGRPVSGIDFLAFGLRRLEFVDLVLVLRVYRNLFNPYQI